MNKNILDKKESEAFENLWKVKILKEIVKFEDGWGGGRVTRVCKFDNKRTLKLIEYGFVEGIKFGKSKQKKENKNGK